MYWHHVTLMHVEPGLSTGKSGLTDPLEPNVWLPYV